MFSKDELQAFLAHEESVYDPAKARAYYLKTRELKGRKAAPKNETKVQRTARLATAQKQTEARMYVDNQLSTKQKTETAGNRSTQQARLTAVKAKADASRKRIDGKLNKLLEELKAKAASVKQTPLNVIPTNATPKQRAYLEKQNARISAGNKAASDKVASEVVASKKAASAEMRKVGTEMKAAVASARKSYATASAQIQTKYKAASAKEYANIKANVR